MMCSVELPYAALAICTGISLRHNISMIMMRKESKEYGTRQIIEGVYHINNKVLIVEDVITSGKSILNAAQILRAYGLIVHAVVFLDREEGEKNIWPYSEFKFIRYSLFLSFFRYLIRLCLTLDHPRKKKKTTL